MAQITFEVPNSQVARMVHALCVAGGYTGDPDDTPAQREFARLVVREYIVRTVRRVELQEAVEALEASRPQVDPLDVS